MYVPYDLMENLPVVCFFSSAIYRKNDLWKTRGCPSLPYLSQKKRPKMFTVFCSSLNCKFEVVSHFGRTHLRKPWHHGSCGSPPIYMAMLRDILHFQTCPNIKYCWLYIHRSICIYIYIHIICIMYYIYIYTSHHIRIKWLVSPLQRWRNFQLRVLSGPAADKWM